MEKKINEDEIKRLLNIKDWKHLKKDQVVELYGLLRNAKEDTVNSILSQLPEFKETSKAILDSTENQINSVLKGNNKVTNAVLTSYQSTVSFLQNYIDKHDEFSFEERKYFIDKIFELHDKMDVIENRNKGFLAFISNNIVKVAGIAAGGIGAAYLIGTGKGGEVVKFFADNIKKIKGDTDSDDLNLTDDIINDKNA